MKQAWVIGIWLLCWLLAGEAVGQTLSSKRCKWVTINAAPVQLDTLTIAENSIEVYDSRQVRLHRLFLYDPATNRFQFTNLLQTAVPSDTFPTIDGTEPFLVSFPQNKPKTDSVLVCYRVLPINLAKPAFKRDIANWDSLSFAQRQVFEPTQPREELFKTPGLNKTGSISRGVSFGNTQNVFVNSALNLQLEGKLTEDISITGSITDQNIPFQPEGNTQQLQEFDRVFITLQHRLWTLTGGDVVLRNKPASHFLRFYKNVQGGALEVNRGKPGWESSTTVAASVAKGKFASENITPIESVQGPYRLRGPNGERFIIILAGSERVYLDGRLLARGYDYDYTIDYNQAEITFTPKWIITRNSRIRVDFEYSDQNYSRSILHANHYQNLGKLKVYGNFYNEADNQNNPLTLNLDNEEKRLLSQIGDNLDLAFAPGADSVRFDRNQVLYIKRDTLASSGTYTIFEYSTDSTQAFYAVSFTELGPGRGNYNLLNTTVNGRVYGWVEPVGGVPQGTYEPIRILPAPVQKQMVTLGAGWSLDKQSEVFVEVAGSKNDLNKFSNLDSQDDQGKGVRVGYQVNEKSLKFLGAYKLNSGLTYEYTDPNFVPIDRYRDVEFDRDWNNPTNTTLAQQTRIEDHILTFAVGGVKDAQHFANYRLSRRYRPGEVDGTQHLVELAQKVAGLELRTNLFLMNNQQVETDAEWVRGEIGAQYPTKYITPGYVYRFDKNRITSTVTEQLVASANYFDDHLFFVQSADTANFKYRAEYSRRVDWRPENGELGNKQVANTYNFSTTTSLNNNHQISALLTLRRLQASDSLAETTVLSKVDWTGDLLKKHLRSELSYVIGTGRELKRQYQFVETVPGQGTHFFEDLNRDGRQDLNEFFESQPSDPPYRRNYIKLFIPTDEYVIAYTNQFTYRLNSSLPREWQETSGWKRIAAKFSALTFISIDKRTTDDDLRSRFNPFSLNFEDSTLLSLSRSYRNTLYFNRSHPKYGVEWTFQQGLQKTLLTNGTDVRNNTSQQVLFRMNLTEVLSGRVNAIRSKRESSSNYLTTKNFLIRSWEATPELSYQPGTKLRYTGSYNWMQRENELGEREKAQFHELGSEVRLSQVNKRTATANLKYINIEYTGLDVSPVAYEMLNGLRPGNNLTWNLAIQQRLSNGLNITLDYDGRKPQGIRSIHTGRMQVSVLF
ncbi:hypothetical protein [Rufibacter sp. DG15C]|uniref:hypothetical protein n=1 Tax=Rufibacter sp. DG15C TaxID=1379909 RepID=UPI0008316378|nr:hypothetical protein [Rufibacter sp. DG15C]